MPDPDNAQIPEDPNDHPVIEPARWSQRGQLRPWPFMAIEAMCALAPYVQQAQRIGEFGCGGSTLWMALLNPHTAIHSVEHDPEWIARVHRALGGLDRGGFHRAAVALHHVPVDPPLGVLAYARALVPYPTFDLLVIDGMHETRVECARRAPYYLIPTGVVWIDNVGDYPEAQALLANAGFRTVAEGTDGHQGWWAGRR